MVCFTLVTVALIFQYAFDMQPCIKCIYQRIGVLGVAITTLIAAFTPFAIRRFLVPLSALICFKILIISREHAYKQHNFDFTSACKFELDFPQWFKIDELIPSVFEVRGACDEINWVFLGQTMPEWLLYILVAILCALIWIFKNDK